MDFRLTQSVEFHSFSRKGGIHIVEVHSLVTESPFILFRFLGNQNSRSPKVDKVMDVTYSTSFESEDDEVTQDEKEKFVFSKNSRFKVEENNSDLDFLCKGVNDLIVRNTNLRMRPKAYWTLNKSPKCVKQQDGEKSKCLLKPAFYMKRGNLNGSASINRRKQLKQIEHDNMVNI
jgi:hypothetical protein